MAADLDKFLESLGFLSEASLHLYRNVIKAGGSEREAMRITQAYMTAIISG